jgi:hypothetical protein
MNFIKKFFSDYKRKKAAEPFDKWFEMHDKLPYDKNWLKKYGHRKKHRKKYLFKNQLRYSL